MVAATRFIRLLQGAEKPVRRPRWCVRPGLGTAAALLLTFTLPSVAVAAGLDDVRADGWYTWRATAVKDVPSLCCMRWNSGNATPTSCSLDDGRGSTMSFDGSSTTLSTTDQLQLYVRMGNGRVERLKTLSPACRIESQTAVTDLGAIDTDDSVAWLTRLIESGNEESEDALASIAMHAGDTALGYVEGVARTHADSDLREDAIFWLGQVRIDEARNTILALMFDDPDAEVREHAAFSYAQSNAGDVAEQLIHQGREDRSAEVRSDAWFWLAQTGASISEEAILHAMQNDPDGDVREDAVFALSQLPGDRAVNALLTVLNNRQLDREIREQALFWLADSDSDSALAAIDRLLSTR